MPKFCVVPVSKTLQSQTHRNVDFCVFLRDEIEIRSYFYKRNIELHHICTKDCADNSNVFIWQCLERCLRSYSPCGPATIKFSSEIV